MTSLLSVYINTDKYDGLDQLNRHGILHGMFDGYSDTINFYRLVSLLDLIFFAPVLSHGGSSFAPEYAQESQKLVNYYRAARQHSAQRP